MDEVTIATDGSSRGNPGQAGWAWVASSDRWQCGSIGVATSIVAELTAAHRALIAVPPQQSVRLLCDSEFVVNVGSKWARNWSRRGWTTKEGKPVANLEVVQAFWATIQGRTAPTKFQWVRGHSGHPLNEAADTLATQASAHGHRQGGAARVAGPGWAP